MTRGLEYYKAHGYSFVFNVGWMRRYGVRGVVLGSRVLFSDPVHEVPRHIFRHELQHVYQRIRDGRWIFFLKYFWWSLQYGYRDNPYEVEARERQHDELTADEEALLWSLKDGSMQ